ncbi:MAG: hypothetical protein J6R88_01850 [Clostridia bacterium]|nr:hypothetical protein [Clostridia bacterium]
MSESEIISILSKFSVEIILLAGLTSIFTGILKKYLPATLKNLTHLLPFLLGVAVYACYSYLVLKSLDLSAILKSGVQIGGVAILMYALIKQLFKKSSNAKNAIYDILKGFVDEASLQGTVNRIIKEFDSAVKNGTVATPTITKIVAETSSVTESESNTLGLLIVKTLNALTKTNKAKTTNSK